MVKLAKLYEQIGGDMEKLLQDSPISALCSRILAMASPKIDKDNQHHHKKHPIQYKKHHKKHKIVDQFTEEELDFLKGCLTTRSMEILSDLSKLIKVVSV